MKVLDLYQIINELNEDIEDIESTIKRVRGANDSWETGIENDERASVKLLYESLCEARQKRRVLMHKEVMISDTATL